MNDDYEIRGTQQAARQSHHRPAAIRLPDDPEIATASVLALINGSNTLTRAAAIEALTERTAALSSTDPDRAIRALALQLGVLNSLFLLYSAESVATKSPDPRGKFLKLALSAQLAYSRTQALVIGLNAQKAGRGRVTVTELGNEP